MSTVLQKTTRIIDRPQVSTLRTRFRKSSRSSDISRERENVSFGPKRKITDPRYSSVINLKKKPEQRRSQHRLTGRGKIHLQRLVNVRIKAPRFNRLTKTMLP